MPPPNTDDPNVYKYTCILEVPLDVQVLYTFHTTPEGWVVPSLTDNPKHGLVPDTNGNLNGALQSPAARSMSVGELAQEVNNSIVEDTQSNTVWVTTISASFATSTLTLIKVFTMGPLALVPLLGPAVAAGLTLYLRKEHATLSRNAIVGVSWLTQFVNMGSVIYAAGMKQ